MGKVIVLLTTEKDEKTKEKVSKQPTSDDSYDFSEIILKNAKKKEKEKEERSKQPVKSIVRSSMRFD